MAKDEAGLEGEMAAETPMMTLTMNERLTLAAAAAPVVAAVVVAEVVAMMLMMMMSCMMMRMMLMMMSCMTTTTLPLDAKSAAYPRGRIQMAR